MAGVTEAIMAIPIIGENFLEEKSTSESIATLIFPQLRATVVVEGLSAGIETVLA